MSEKRLDARNRWRNVVVAFRMSPEEAQELNVKVALSGLSKQNYIIQCLLKHEIRVVGGMKVARKVRIHLDTILDELQSLDDSDRNVDIEELLVPLRHTLPHNHHPAHPLQNAPAHTLPALQLLFLPAKMI